MKRQRKKTVHNKVIIGLTGSFGSGKTTASRILKSWGAGIIDADKIARQLISSRTPVYEKIVQVFGRSILQKNNKINRLRLSRIVFADRKLLGKLNSITHPPIIHRIKEQLRLLPQKVIVIDAPLLIESGLDKIVDKLIVVVTSIDKQIARLKKKTHFKKTDILKRIEAQIKLSEKIPLADFVIDNSGSFDYTKKQLEQIRRKLWKS